jgi:hypothetical protein
MKNPDSRMNYFHVCRDCGRGFDGFQFQHTCWKCIAVWVAIYINK